MKNVAYLQLRDSVEGVLQDLAQIHREQKIHSLSVLYTYGDECQGHQRMYIGQDTAIVVLIGMHEYTKQQLVDHLKNLVGG